MPHRLKLTSISNKLSTTTDKTNFSPNFSIQTYRSRNVFISFTKNTPCRGKLPSLQKGRQRSKNNLRRKDEHFEQSCLLDFKNFVYNTLQANMVDMVKTMEVTAGMAGMAGTAGMAGMADMVVTAEQHSNHLIKKNVRNLNNRANQRHLQNHPRSRQLRHTLSQDIQCTHR